MSLYGPDLALIQEVAFGGYAARLMPRVLAALGEPGTPPRRVLDVGCGAGVSTRALATRGFQVIALDGSADLLAHARKHVPEATWLHRSVWDGPLPACDAAIAIGEVLTYHRAHEDAGERLRWFFRELARVLPEGGQLIFDAIDAEGPPLDAKNFTVTDDWAITSQTVERPGEHRLTRTIDTFMRVEALEAEVWRRAREVHEVVTFDQAQLRAWLEQAGFEKCVIEADPELPRRVLVSAARRAN
ncbi:MAG: class I SAM-dependent methyltransferase [Myxococcaceae bacterium]